MAEDDAWRLGSITEQQNHMLETGFMSDCSFIVGDEGETETFQCHKFPLSRASPVFHAMFHGELKEEGEVRVPDIQPPAFRHMLKFIYTDKVDLPDLEMALAVRSAANKYMILPLATEIVNFIKTKLGPKDVHWTLQFAQMFSDTELTDVCIKMIQSQTESIISAASWLDSDLSFVLTVLQQDSLNVNSELSLLSACLRWGQKHTQNNTELRKLLTPALKLIRLRSMTTEKFVSGSRDINFFSAEEKLQIIQSIVSPDQDMPEGFCNEREQREKITCVIRPRYPKNVSELKINFIKTTVYYLTPNFLGIRFSASENILIYGIELQIQEDFRIAGPMSAIQDTFVETIYIELRYKDDESKIELKKARVKYDSIVHISLPEPYFVRKNNVIGLYLSDSRRGYPKIIIKEQSSRVKDVDFTIEANRDRGIMINSIFFNKHAF